MNGTTGLIDSPGASGLFVPNALSLDINVTASVGVGDKNNPLRVPLQGANVPITTSSLSSISLPEQAVSKPKGNFKCVIM